MKAKIMGALFAVLALALLVGCTEKFTEDEVNILLEEQGIKFTESFQAQFDVALGVQDELRGQLAELTVDLETEKANSAKVAELETLIAELQANLDAAEEVTDAADEEVIVEEEDFFLIEDVPLDGNFDVEIDNDDLELLAYSDVDYDDETIDFEEKLYFLDSFAPVLNVEDFGADIFVGIADNDALSYMLEFDDPVVFIDDEELDIKFLGQDYTLVDYSDDELTFRVSKEYEGSYGDTWTINGVTVTIMEIDGDGEKEKVRIKAGSETEIIEVGEEREVGGLSIYVDEVFVATIPEDMAWVSLYIGEDIVQEVAAGDEFMDLDDWEWVIEEDNAGDLLSLGVQYTEKLNDDDEYWTIGDGMCFPLDYVCIEYLEVRNADVVDVELNIDNDELEVSFDGKVEVNGDRIDDGEFTVDLATLEYEYRYKGDKVEGLTDFNDIVFFADDRDLSFDMGSGVNDWVRIFDATQNYEFKYVAGEFFESAQDATDMNDDEDFRMDCGDILYNSEVNTDDNDDTVTIGLVSDEDLEVILKVQ